MTIAIDFDGTLCRNAHPAIGEEIPEVVTWALTAKAMGDKLILWTCRTGAELDAAVAWCAERGLYFDAVNENVPEHIAKYGGDTRKVYADLHIDDNAATLDMVVATQRAVNEAFEAHGTTARAVALDKLRKSRKSDE